MGSLNGLKALTHVRSGRIAALLLMAISLSGCGSLNLKMPKMPWSQDNEPDYPLIADNLVNSLSQFPHLNPLMATVQMVEPRSAFNRQIKEVLVERGYKVETIAGDVGLNRVQPQIKPINSEDSVSAGGKESLYVLSIGKVSVERAYSTVAGKTVPVSEQVIRGIKKRKVKLNDDIFDASDSAFSAVAFKPYAGPLIDDMLAAPGVKVRKAGFFNREKQSVIKKNMYETMVSNYSGVFTGYEDVEQSILVFPNDSLRLGDANKQIIEQFVDRMDPETDVLSVIGCSHGKTEISNGNSLLALGRANRVKEAFLFSGLEHDKILDEGCWAPRTFDEVMPRRGVVLTLKRQKES